MRPLIPTVIAATLLFAAPAAIAAPTCVDQYGVTARCGTPLAMPVGWTLPPGHRSGLDPTLSMDPANLAALIAILFGFFALIALMPDFDGSHGADWDAEQGDDDRD